MGQITIEMKGSFKNQETTETALRGGHAAAIGRAIDFLAKQLPDAIAQDHELQRTGQSPPMAPFGRHDKQ